MKYILVLFAFSLLYTASYSQDTIVQKNGAHIASKVLEISKYEVKFKKFDNIEGPAYDIPKSDVIYIRYQNGAVDSFNVADPNVNLKYTHQVKSEMYLKGEHDGKTYYKNYKPAATWTLALTIPLNAFGIFPAVAFSGTPPRKENLGYPDETLMKDPEYYTGYIAGAKDKKGSKVMKNFAIGALCSFLIYGTLAVTVLNK
jgi:hypothetical protein